MTEVTKKQARRSQKIVVIATIAILIIPYVAALFVPFTSPYAQFPLHVVRCGGLPIVATDFAASSAYITPRQDGYGVTSFTNRFFCTEEAAKANGYRKLD